MKILIVSTYAETTPIAYRLENEGHEVYLYIKDKDSQDIFDGICYRIDDWKKAINNVDLIIFDYTDHGNDAVELRKQGIPVIGGTPYTDELERNREFGQSEFQKAGFTILPSHEFTSFDEAEHFIVENPKKYVIKLNGKAADEKESTYVGKEDNGNDVIAVLRHYEKKLAGGIDSFELQEVIDGVEIGIGAAFNGTDFIEPIEINFEHKKFATGNLGQNTGEMGTSAFFVTKEHPLYKKTISKMIPFLQGYHGIFDINFIANADGIFPLEPTCRFGYPINALQTEVIISDMGERLIAIAKGTDPQSKIMYKFGVVLCGVIPPFPFETKEIFKKLSEDNLIIFKNGRKEGIYPVEIREEDEQWYVTGGSGEPFLAVALGNTMKEAKLNAYTNMVNVITPNLFYRIDISDRWEIDYPRLIEWGYLSPSDISLKVAPKEYSQTK